ncbi:MAG: glycosyltransferase family 2 protein [Anaerolineae bacterium]|nr:glycosyltransferase family 2 protein [Anaerolineae bacterium]
MDLAIVIVNWNVRDLLRRCLASLQAAIETAGVDTTVVVVDNGSADGSVAMLQAEFPWVQVIASPTNVGFTRGNNLALRMLGFTDPIQGPGEGAGGLGLPHYILLLNPDTEVPPTALATLLAHMDAHPEIGLLGPRLRNADGSLQSSRRRFPTLATGLLESTVLQQWWPTAPPLQRFYMADQPEDQPQAVDWLVGACMLTRREALVQVGLLDEGYFMYSEEVDWARRFKALGWQVVYLPTAEVLHYEGRSSGQVVAQRAIYFHTSKVRYFRKWHGPLVGEGIRLFLLATYVYHTADEGARWLLGHKRPLRAARVRAYWQVLRSGLR